MSATLRIADYYVVLAKVQNVYGVERDRDVGWCFGFKYDSGVFEFFTYRTKEKAERHLKRLLLALDAYYEGGE